MEKTPIIAGVAKISPTNGVVCKPFALAKQERGRHTAMLLAAGKYLADAKNFNGTVRLIFQPGEETMEGGPAMIVDGLFTRFPVDAVFSMHNMPGLDLGKLYFTEAEVMAAVALTEGYLN